MTTQYSFTTNSLRHQKRLACGLIPLLNFLQDRGIDNRVVLDYAGIRKVELIDPGFTISFEQELKIVEKAISYLPRDYTALDLASYYHLHNFSVLGLAIRSCATLGEIFDLIMRYPRLVWGICDTSSRIDGSMIHFELSTGLSREEQFLLERDMGCVKTLFGEALSSDLELVEVWFNTGEPKNP